jgi:hypothetical protein
MAGQIVVSSIKTDSDNSISFLANTGATIFSANISNGISGSFVGDGTITNAKITDSTITTGKFASSANSAITGKSVAMAIVFGG